MRRLSKIWAPAVAALIGVSAAATAGETQLSLAHDLAADGSQSAATAILVFYMTDSCPYCQQVEELYLEPMQQRRTYGDRLLIRAVRADSAKPLRDFSGKQTDHESFARREGAYLTPLVRLYAPDGTALATPLLGYTSPDFYGGELEGRIEKAIAHVRPTAARADSQP